MHDCAGLRTGLSHHQLRALLKRCIMLQTKQQLSETQKVVKDLDEQGTQMASNLQRLDKELDSTQEKLKEVCPSDK